MNPEVLFEDNHLLIVNKPAGLLTQSDSSGDSSLLDGLKEYIKKRDNKPGNVYLGMVQRLDKPVSGVIFFAKTSKAASRLSAEIRGRKAKKFYLAITPRVNVSLRQESRFKEYQSLFVRKRDKTFVEEKSTAGQIGVLKDMVLHSNEQFSVHLIRLVTGRKHQIRAQLSHLGSPIIGDYKYDSKEKHVEDNGIALHAYHGEMLHPVKKEPVSCTTVLPKYFLSYFPSSEIEKIEDRLAIEI